VATVILGWLLLGEPLKPLQSLGTLLVLAGVALCAFTPPVRETPSTPIPG
jgi:drug/metabolite transporter (DMT)-like permease